MSDDWIRDAAKRRNIARYDKQEAASQRAGRERTRTVQFDQELRRFWLSLRALADQYVSGYNGHGPDVRLYAFGTSQWLTVMEGFPSVSWVFSTMPPHQVHIHLRFISALSGPLLSERRAKPANHRSYFNTWTWRPVMRHRGCIELEEDTRGASRVLQTPEEAADYFIGGFIKGLAD